MCLGIPGEVIELHPEQPDLAKVNVSGVRRMINIGLLADDPPKPGEWVLGGRWDHENWKPNDLREMIRSEVEGYAEVTEAELAGGGLMKKGLFVSTGAL